jgi:hypothetical protein
VRGSVEQRQPRRLYEIERFGAVCGHRYSTRRFRTREQAHATQGEAPGNAAPNNRGHRCERGPAGSQTAQDAGNGHERRSTDHREVEMPNPTEAVLRRHLQAAGESVDAVMEHYDDESVLITHEATHRGRSEIRRFFTELLEGASKGFINAFKMNRQEISGEVAYILWEAKPWFPFATDTLVVRHGKIVLQTFAASK